MTSAKAHAERRRLEWVEASGLDLELLDDAVDTWPRFGSRIWAGSRPDWITPGYHEELWWVAFAVL